MQCPQVQWAPLSGPPGAKPPTTDAPLTSKPTVGLPTKSQVLKSSGWTAKDMEAEEKRERHRRQRQKVIGCCKKFVTFLFSHIGLAGLVVGYSILGGFLFQWIEAPSEWREKYRIRAVKEETIDALELIATHFKESTINITEFQNKARGNLLYFQREIVLAVKEKGWDGNDDISESSIQWSFAGALLYAVTVITTIGYGHVAPKTVAGRLVTIVYALFGIPLTFLYLSNIGTFLADAFRLFYKKVCCDVFCCKKCERKRKRERLKMRRRRELAAQRNTILGGPTESFGISYGAADDCGIDLEYIPPTTPLGLPGGNDNLALEVETEFVDEASSSQETPRQNSRQKPDGCEEPDQNSIRETAILDDDITDSSVRETAILDDEVGSEQDKKSKTEPSTPSSEFFMSRGALEKLDDAKETDILDSDDDMLDDSKRAKSTGDLDEECHESDMETDTDDTPPKYSYKSLPLRGRSLKNPPKDPQGKMSKKEQRALSKERAKEEKMLKKLAKKEKSLERKKSKERDKEKKKEKDKKDKDKEKNGKIKDKKEKDTQDKDKDKTDTGKKKKVPTATLR